MKRTAFSLVLLIASLLVASCATYQRGNPGKTEFATVYIKPVVNDSSFPLLESSLTARTRKAINETGFLRSEDKNQAETILEVSISDFDRDVTAIQQSDLGREKKVMLEMEISMSLFQSDAENTPIFENKTFMVRQDIFTDSDIATNNFTNQVDAEHQATPELSRKIATRIAEILSETW